MFLYIVPGKKKKKKKHTQKIKRGAGPLPGPEYVVYRVLSIYRVLPGFREFAVFEKSKRFFYIFFGWVLHRGGQGPGKGPNK